MLVITNLGIYSNFMLIAIANIVFCIFMIETNSYIQDDLIFWSVFDSFIMALYDVTYDVTFHVVMFYPTPPWIVFSRSTLLLSILWRFTRRLYFALINTPFAHKPLHSQT